MKIKNSFVQESFVWNGHSNDDFRNAAKHLSEVVTYLHDLDEPVYGQDGLYSQEILQDTPIYSFYERDEEDPFNDEKQMVILSLQGIFHGEEDERFDEEIGLQFYTIENPTEGPTRQSNSFAQYLFQRRGILTGCVTCQEFSSFMRTCFRNIIFAEDIEKGIRGIPNFRQPCVREAIVHDLGVLNDEGLSIYEKHYPQFEEMFKELSVKVLDCSPDKPENKKYLTFSFSYSLDSGETQIKAIFCSPHTKLIRRDSDLRIYFDWQDADVGAGQKVLVGHIGGHPYPKKR